ncbi:hypothetical protein [Tateyamaria sp. SN6-1]|uniref:hypothetical protein n=1 Tax=Tateyamaria sp. SN6-1 TaxID=3092148 RepID=UPI0039F6484A
MNETVEVSPNWFLPPETVRGATTFFAIGSRTGLRLTETFEFLEQNDADNTAQRRFMLATDESGVIFQSKPEGTRIVVDWVPQGGGPLKLMGYLEDGTEVEVATDPHPDEQHYRRQFETFIPPEDGVFGFFLFAESEAGFSRVCVGREPDALPRPFEDVVQALPNAFPGARETINRLLSE